MMITKDAILDMATKYAYGETKDLEDFLERINGVSLKSFLNIIENKTCAKNLKKFLKGDFISDYELSLALSSLLTQSLLAMETDYSFFISLHISKQAQTVSRFINAEITKDETLAIYKELLK